jgi:hypothetical protein
MNEQYTALNQLFANLYALSKTWYEIRDKDVDIVDMEKMFELCLKHESFMENAREGRNLMAKLKEKYVGLGATGTGHQ